MLQEMNELLNIALETNLPARFLQMLSAHSAKGGIVPQQVSQLGALLHYMSGRQTRHFLGEVVDA